MGVVRVRVRCGEGARSTIGGIFTQRSRDGFASERLYGLDFDLKPTQRTEVSGFWAESALGRGDGCAPSRAVESRPATIRG